MSPAPGGLPGGELASWIRAAVAARAAELTAAGRTPRLAVVTATAEEASTRYVRSLARTAARAGIACDVTDLVPASPSRPASQSATVEGIREALATLSEDPAVHGILLQTPLPEGARLAALAGLIDPAKDGANPVSLGRLMTGLPAFAPATAAAVLALLDHSTVTVCWRCRGRCRDQRHGRRRAGRGRRPRGRGGGGGAQPGAGRGRAGDHGRAAAARGGGG